MFAPLPFTQQSCTPPSFTSCRLVPASGCITVLRALRMLVVSWCTNLLGCVMLVGLMYAGDVFGGRK